MFDSKSPIVKYVGYFIIGFFLLIIIISFGMPDFMSRLGLDQSIVATVNGEPIHRFTFLRYRDTRFGHMRNEKMTDYILNSLIQETLMMQKARKEGFDATDERIMRTIKEMQAFKDETGRYSAERFDLVLKQNNMSFSEFYKLVKDDLTRREMDNSIRLGIAVTSRDAKDEFIANNSKFQIRYAFLSKRDLKKRYARRVTVTDAEVEEELKKNIKNIKDPKTDRKRMRKKLEKKKLADLESQLIADINAVAQKGGLFGAAATILRGERSMSLPFKAGEQVKDSGKKKRQLGFLANSPVFSEKLLNLKPGQSSPAIKTAEGIYIFTPVVQNIARKKPEKKDLEKAKESIRYGHYRTVAMNMMKQMSMESKIIKNLKTQK